MDEPNKRHPLGQHEELFKVEAERLRRLHRARVPLIIVGDHYRIAGPLPPGFDLRGDEDED